METTAMTRSAWSGLADINDVTPLAEHERACLADIRDVLERHGALDRFGVTLLHSHFPLADDEVLLESVDPDARLLETRVVKADDEAATTAIETSWRLDDLTGQVRCETMCLRPEGPRGPHQKTHYENSPDNSADNNRRLTPPSAP